MDCRTSWTLPDASVSEFDRDGAPRRAEERLLHPDLIEEFAPRRVVLVVADRRETKSVT
jgi:hypothetical protein